MQMSPRLRFKADFALDRSGFPYEVIEIYNDGGAIAGFSMVPQDYVDAWPFTEEARVATASSEASIPRQWVGIHYFHPVATGATTGLIGWLEAYEVGGTDSEFETPILSRNHTLWASELSSAVLERSGGLTLISYVRMWYKDWEGDREIAYRLDRSDVGGWFSFAGGISAMVVEPMASVLECVHLSGDTPLGSFGPEDLGRAPENSWCREWIPPGGVHGVTFSPDKYWSWESVITERAEIDATTRDLLTNSRQSARAAE